MNCDAQSLIAASACYDCIPPGLQSAVQMMLACEWANAGPGGCSDPVVTDWLQRLADDFQPMPSQATVDAVCDFCVALRAYGIMDDMLVVNPVIPDTLLAMRYPLIYQVGNGNSPFINHNFLAANLNNDGLVGDGGATDQYMDTGFVPDTHWGIVVESAGITVYQAEVGVDAGLVEIEVGVSDVGTVTDFYLSTYDYSINDAEGVCWSGLSALNGGLVAETPALYTMNRTAVNFATLHQGNSVLGFNLLDTNAHDETGEALPDEPCYFMANRFGTPDRFSSKRVSFMSIHEGLSPGDAENFFEAVQALRIALLGGYV